ncbi:hypothetical protein CEXT_234261 [Caerostris extrusa]|uniref:Uncharacterized protein n=1 Tax=Caerostris extrusa TaxID=172846 RepID=A0AAV4QVF4_CAEEX|nr:hypothetical protein CEXT_234261 [Caerostris extrusa]
MPYGLHLTNKKYRRNTIRSPPIERDSFDRPGSYFPSITEMKSHLYQQFESPITNCDNSSLIARESFVSPEAFHSRKVTDYEEILENFCATSPLSLIKCCIFVKVPNR